MRPRFSPGICFNRLANLLISGVHTIRGPEATARALAARLVAHLCLLVALQGMVAAWLQDCNARLLPAALVIRAALERAEADESCPLFLPPRISEILRSTKVGDRPWISARLAGVGAVVRGADRSVGGWPLAHQQTHQHLVAAQLGRWPRAARSRSLSRRSLVAPQSRACACGTPSALVHVG